MNRIMITRTSVIGSTCTNRLHNLYDLASYFCLMQDHYLQVYLVDYGLALKYSPDGSHKVYKEDPRKAHDGTIEFTSTDAHKGVGMSSVFHIEASSKHKTKCCLLSE